MTKAFSLTLALALATLTAMPASAKTLTSGLTRTEGPTTDSRLTTRPTTRIQAQSGSGGI